MAYIKFKDGRELKGWRASLIAVPLAIAFAPIALVMAIAALPIIAASKLKKDDGDSSDSSITKG
jgi:hypothetical protein